VFYDEHGAFVASIDSLVAHALAREQLTAAAAVAHAARDLDGLGPVGDGTQDGLT
jgi:hypothetical protein